ncbi:MAG: restriction endonuclease subunit S [Candidatus Thiothrix moscowensis]|nr:restriction endonuclease subunit S [Candidatus Thiothrix moscowensis]
MTEGNQWFGKTPDGWQIKRNKEIFAEVSTPSKTGEETLLTVSHITGVTPRSEKNVNMFMAENMTGYKQCKPGDLIINTMWAWMGALGTSKYAGICSPAYGVYRPRRGVDYHAGYFDYLFRTPNAIMEMTRYSKGIVSSRLRLYPKDFYQIETCLPPYAEQKAIADYLEKQTSLLDRKIILLNNKIEKYQRLRTSLINKTVCHGLGNSIEVVDSGFEWLGKVPRHWSVEQVKNLAYKIGSGITPKGGSETYVDSGVIFIRSQNVYDDGLRLDGVSYISSDVNELMKSSQLVSGDVLINITGASIGRSCAFPPNVGAANINQHIAFVRLKKKYRRNYFSIFFKVNCVKEYIRTEQTGASKEAFTLAQIANLAIPVPPVEEQEAIATYLDDKTGRIDAIVAKLKEQVEKLQELRKTLIQDVVTGKIRVVDGVRA